METRTTTRVTAATHRIHDGQNCDVFTLLATWRRQHLRVAGLLPRLLPAHDGCCNRLHCTRRDVGTAGGVDATVRTATPASPLTLSWRFVFSVTAAPWHLRACTPLRTALTSPRSPTHLPLSFCAAVLLRRCTRAARLGGWVTAPRYLSCPLHRAPFPTHCHHLPVHTRAARGGRRGMTSSTRARCAGRREMGIV